MLVCLRMSEKLYADQLETASVKNALQGPTKACLVTPHTAPPQSSTGHSAHSTSLPSSPAPPHGQHGEMNALSAARRCTSAIRDAARVIRRPWHCSSVGAVAPSGATVRGLGCLRGTQPLHATSSPSRMAKLVASPGDLGAYLCDLFRTCNIRAWEARYEDVIAARLMD